MTQRPVRVVDAHVHIWDPARSDWYPYLAASGPKVPGGSSAMKRRFDVDTYRSESAGWNVEKFVNVAAATGRNSVEETLELDREAGARGGPDAIIGGLPPTETVAEAIELIDRQMSAPRFRGVRPMGAVDRPVPEPEVLRALAERGLIFELMAHPDQLLPSAEKLKGLDDLTVLVEHTGWPRSDSDEERELCLQGLSALASSSANFHCKLSGLSGPCRSMKPDAFAPWLEHAIDAFGADRCMFASNFPVDSAFGSFDDLYDAYAAVTSGLDADTRDKLFAGNAQRIYRL